MKDEATILNNFITKVTSIPESLKEGEVTKLDHIIKVDTGLPSDTFNVIVVSAPITKKFSIDLLQAIEGFEEKNFPVSIWVDQRFITDELVKLLNDLNYEIAERNRTMKLDSNDQKEVSLLRKDLDIRQVKSRADLLMFVDVMQSLFGQTPEARAIQSYFNHIANDFNNHHYPMKMFIGLHDNQVVSSGAFIDGIESYGIYDLMTKVNKQGKGFGTSMFHYLLKQMNLSPSKPCILQASPEGLNLYKKAGFEEVGEMLVFEKQ